ncbi:MAG: hypothetical protein AAF721_20380 [Myxococcota bacterium]
MPLPRVVVWTLLAGLGVGVATPSAQARAPQRGRAVDPGSATRAPQADADGSGDPAGDDGSGAILYPDPAPPYEPEPKSPVSEVDTLPEARPPTPRVLSTLYGRRPSEQTRHEARRVPVTFTPDLQVRARAGAVSEFTIDRQGSQYIEGVESGGRVRWRPALTLGRREQVEIVGMLDIANGRWSPQRATRPEIADIIDNGGPPVPTGLRLLDPRELYVQWTSRAGQLRLGQMSFTCGQGLVANDGNNLDRFGDLRFGNDGDGSIQERLLFATKPLATVGGPGKDIVVALGADLVYRDPNASLRDGDLAGQGILVVRWQPEDSPGNWLGTYAAYRRQKSADDGDVYDDDDDLEVGVFDLAGQGSVQRPGGLALIGAFEAAAIVGRTTFLADERDHHRVLQGGGALRAFFGKPARWLAGFDAGVASGDANPDDGVVQNFSAAPGFNAGLLMFQYYQGWQSARSQRLAEDPELLAVPPNGTQYIPTNGTVTNAVFLHPKAQWSWQERFEVWGGPLIAASAVPVVDPFVSRLEGGDVANALGGRPDSRQLGTELDLGIRSRYEMFGMWMQAGFQAAVYFPGPAFVRGDGDIDKPMFGGWFRAEVRY